MHNVASLDIAKIKYKRCNNKSIGHIITNTEHKYFTCHISNIIDSPKAFDGIHYNILLKNYNIMEFRASLMPGFTAT